MKKKIDRTMIMTTIVCLLPIILSVIVYNKLPDRVPIHWNGEGVIDNYASKAVGAFGLPVLMAIINMVTHFCLNTDPKQRNASRVLMLIGKWTIPCLTIILMPVTLFSALGYTIKVDIIMPNIVGIIIIICGNYLPKCKQNYTVGIKVPWTLNSEENWNKTHRLGGYVWMIGGLALCILTWLNIYKQIATIAIVIIISIIPCIYSYLLYKKGI